MKKTSFEFSKLHGCGNSFVVIDDRRARITTPEKLAVLVSSADVGIGSDGLILVRSSKRYDVRMDYFNADGTAAEMCGNGVRCLAKFVADKKISRKRELTVETLAGPIRTRLVGKNGVVAQVTVDMGTPAFRSGDIIAKRSPATGLAVGGRSYTFVSMGNPHAVTFVDNFDFDLEKAGRTVECTRRLFPNKTNVGFAQIRSRKEMRLRVWERGCGLTQACGTGACAAVVAATLHGKLGAGPISVEVDGGTLRIRWDRRSGRIFMTGPATLVAEGRLSLA